MMALTVAQSERRSVSRDLAWTGPSPVTTQAVHHTSGSDTAVRNELHYKFRVGIAFRSCAGAVKEGNHVSQ